MKVKTTLPSTLRSVLIVLFFFKATPNLFAQKPLLVQNISFSATKMTYTQLAKEIKQQSDINVAFNAESIKSNGIVQLPKASLTVKELAAFLYKNYGISSQFIGRTIILKASSTSKIVNKQTKETKKKRLSLLPKKASKSKQKIEEQAIEVAKVEPKSTWVVPRKIILQDFESLDTIYSFPDTLSLSDTSMALILAQFAMNDPDYRLDPYRRLTDPDIITFSPPFWENFKFGFQFFADDYFYANPAIILGYMHFSVMGRFATNGAASHFRYGVQYTLPINEKLSLSLWSDYGNVKLNRDLNWTFSRFIPDTTLQGGGTTIFIDTSISYKLQSGVLKLGLNANYEIVPNFELFGGIVFNRAINVVYFGGEKLAPNLFLPTTAPLRKEDYLLLPSRVSIGRPLTFNNSTNIQTTFGLQLGLRFYFFRKNFEN
ncbi:MAG TPA: hypothetical protein VLZ83_03015 [Edaphocola sp.]|nr:hypothetical protein [Edaphocola sp.]